MAVTVQNDQPLRSGSACGSSARTTAAAAPLGVSYSPLPGPEGIVTVRDESRLWPASDVVARADVQHAANVREPAWLTLGTLKYVEHPAPPSQSITARPAPTWLPRGHSLRAIGASSRGTSRPRYPT